MVTLKFELPFFLTASLFYSCSSSILSSSHLPPTPAGLPTFSPSGVAFPEECPACRPPSGGGWCIFDERSPGDPLEGHSYSRTMGLTQVSCWPSPTLLLFFFFPWRAGESRLEFQPMTADQEAGLPNTGLPGVQLQVLLSGQSCPDSKINTWLKHQFNKHLVWILMNYITLVWCFEGFPQRKPSMENKCSLFDS